jgi:hypothetical protein
MMIGVNIPGIHHYHHVVMRYGWQSNGEFA